MRPTPDAEQAQKLQEELGLPQAAAELLVQRGLETPGQARQFLDPQLGDDLHSPHQMDGMEKLVERLVQALENDEIVAIHGDYDVDGLTSTAFFVHVLERLGFEVLPFVPDRMADGYGVSPQALEKFQEAGATVVLTCDTGIAAHHPLERAREMGLDVLVTDHHLPDDRLPPAHAIVNPNRSECSYPFSDLCGVGVAYKVGQALCEALDEDPRRVLHSQLELVALGTVCDVVPLRGENRVLAQAGIRRIRRTGHPGLKALFEHLELEAEEIDEKTLGWTLGPRLNAVGRIDEARLGLELLLASSGDKADRLARRVDELNDRRRELTDQIEEQAHEMIAEIEDQHHHFTLFAPEDEKWHQGVLGIVASRLVNEYGRPTFLFARDERTGRWRGSGRADSHDQRVHLRDALASVRNRLEDFGGHQAAAGTTLAITEEGERLAFIRELEEVFQNQQKGEGNTPVLRADLEIELDEVHQGLYNALSYFWPFGEGNEEVKFVAHGVQVTRARRVGKNREHVKLNVVQNGTRLEALGWGGAEYWRELHETPYPYEADLMFRIEQHEYRGRQKLQLIIEDAQVTRSSQELAEEAN